MKAHSITTAIAATAAGILFLISHAAGQQPSEVRVLASNGVKAVIEELVPRGERAIGHRLAITFNSSQALKQSIDKGDAFDVAIMTTEMIDELIKEGKIVAGTEVGVARSGIGVGIRSGAPKPAIKTAAAIKQTLLDAKAITYAQDGASRVHILEMLDHLGIADQVGHKTILEQGSVRSAGRVAAGDADLIMTLISEILPIKGVELVGPLPSEFQSYVTLAAGVGAKAGNPESARALIRFLTSPDIAPTLKAKGMERPHRN